MCSCLHENALKDCVQIMKHVKCNEKIMTTTSETCESVMNDKSIVDAETTPMKSKYLFDVDSSDFDIYK